MRCETNRTATSEQQRQARKASASNPLPDTPLIPRPWRQRALQARIGLVSQLCTHRQIRSWRTLGWLKRSSSPPNGWTPPALSVWRSFWSSWFWRRQWWFLNQLLPLSPTHKLTKPFCASCNLPLTPTHKLTKPLLCFLQQLKSVTPSVWGMFSSSRPVYNTISPADSGTSSWPHSILLVSRSSKGWWC